MRRSNANHHADASLAFPPSAPERPGVIENTGSQSVRAYFLEISHLADDKENPC